MAPTAGRAPKGRAHHRRDPAAHLAVLQAADDLLVERGFGGVTVEGIAARAGVAKQTIYRWWSSKADILLDGLIEDAEEPLAIPVRGTVTSRMRRHMHAVASFVTKEDSGKVLLALVGEAQHDRQLARTLDERYFTPLRERERALLAQGVQDGELSAELDIDAALDTLNGPIIYRALLGRRVPRAFVDALVATALRTDA